MRMFSKLLVYKSNELLKCITSPWHFYFLIPWTLRSLRRNYSGRHHLDATNKMILYPLPHKSI